MSKTDSKHMTRDRLVCCFVIAFGAATLAPKEPAEHLRQASAAYSEGNFDLAVKYCEAAEDRTHDPGLVAFNKAAALYRTGNFHSAGLHYRRSLADAGGMRLACGLYNLANCLVIEGAGKHQAGLSAAIDLYERCLEQVDTASTLAADARYNLELAKFLLKTAKVSSATTDSQSTQNPPGSNSSEPRVPGGLDDRIQGLKQNAEPEDDSEKTQPERPSDHLPRAGKGNLPAIPDEPNEPAFSPNEAREKLQKAVERIMHEGREHRIRAARSLPSNVKDW